MRAPAKRERMPSSNPPRVLVPVADGSEDIETSCITDVLVRSGVKVTVSSVMPDRKTVTMARGLVLTAESLITEESPESYDAIVIPGGMPGAKHIADSKPFADLLHAVHKAHKLVGAICAAPVVVLATHGILKDGMNCTCFPGMAQKVPQGVTWVNEPVVHDEKHKLVMSQGPGTAILFALFVAKLLVGEEKSTEVGKALLVYH